MLFPEGGLQRRAKLVEVRPHRQGGRPDSRIAEPCRVRIFNRPQPVAQDVFGPCGTVGALPRAFFELLVRLCHIAFLLRPSTMLLRSPSSTCERDSSRLPSRLPVDAPNPSKQAMIEFVWTSREDADMPTVRMFGIEENICI